MCLSVIEKIYSGKNLQSGNGWKIFRKIDKDGFGTSSKYEKDYVLTGEYFDKTKGRPVNRWLKKEHYIQQNFKGQRTILASSTGEGSSPRYSKGFHIYTTKDDALKEFDYNKYQRPFMELREVKYRKGRTLGRTHDIQVMVADEILIIKK